MAELIDLQKALDEIKAYDLERIPRRSDLGTALNFEIAVEPAKRIQGFFNRIPADYVSDLSDNFRNLIYNKAMEFLNILGQIQSFDAGEDSNPTATRANIIATLDGFYESAFSELHAAVAFIAARQRDFSSLEGEARSAAESANRKAKELTDVLEARQKEAETVLTAIRKVAAEQGVSQQASYFKDEADEYETSINKWEKYTILTAIGLGVYALVSLIFSMIYTPSDTYEAFQLGLSKVLIFGVIAYMLVYCSRNSTAHRHNQIVNRHRENALLTFNALVEAAGADDKRDIILTHASACIFSPQDTGYTKSAQSNQLPTTQLIEAVPHFAARITE